MKCVKYGLKPLAVLLMMTVVAMVAAHDIVYGATDEKKAAVTSTMPELQVKAQQEKKSYKPTSISSNKYAQPLVDIPQSIAVVPESVIQDQQATTLREALRNVPGISLQAGEGGVPAGDNLSIRGFNARTDMFVDGVRDFGGYTRDPFNMEQLEVFKGPTSSYAGRGSAGGYLNQVSKTPRLEKFYRGSVGFGSDYYKRTTVDLNKPLENFPIEGTAVRLNGLFHDADASGRDEVTNKRWGVAPSLVMGLGTPLRVNFNYFYMGQDNLPDYGIPWIPQANATGALTGLGEQPAPVDWHNFYGLTERDYEKIGTHMFTGKVEYDVNDSVSLRDQFRYGVSKRDSIVTAPRFLNTANTQINRQVQSRDQRDNIFNNQTDATLKFDTGSFGHTLITGVEYTRENSDNRPRTGLGTPTADFYNPQPGQSYTSQISIAAFENEATSNSVGLYGFETLALHEKLDLVGGLRWDYFDTLFIPSNDDDTLHRLDKMFSWRGGAVFKPIETGSIYFGYGTSFNPAAEGLALSSAANNAANVLLNPEKTRTFEIGTKWDLLQEKLQLTAAIFRTDKTNARVTDPGTNAASTADDVVVLQGSQRVYGIEVGAAGNVTDEWRVFVGYSAMQSRIVTTLNPLEQRKDLPNSPEQTFSLWTTYELPLNLEIGGGVQFVDTRFSNTTNTRKAPEYWLFDIMAAYHMTDNLTFRINATNLADQEYIGSVGGGHFIPGPGRQIVAATEFEF